MSIALTVRSPLHAETKCAEKPRSARRVGRALSFKSKKPLKTRKQRKSRIMYHFTREELEPFFHISQKEAAKRLGIAVITLKRICKRGQFNWPYRANKTRESQERQLAAASAVRPAPTKMKPAKKTLTPKQPTQLPPTLRRSKRSPMTGSDGEHREAVCEALRSLALCAYRIEQDETERANMTAAAMTFSRLPMLCMLENQDTIMV